MTARRLATDAKIVLRRAGYDVREHQTWFNVWGGICLKAVLIIKDGTVDNQDVKSLLKSRDCNEWGYKLK